MGTVQPGDSAEEGRRRAASKRPFPRHGNRVPSHARRPAGGRPAARPLRLNGSLLLARLALPDKRIEHALAGPQSAAQSQKRRRCTAGVPVARACPPAALSRARDPGPAEPHLTPSRVNRSPTPIYSESQPRFDGLRARPSQVCVGRHRPGERPPQPDLRALAVFPLQYAPLVAGSAAILAAWTSTPRSP